MNSREKKIFFAGVSVGTQLKGWASAGGGNGGTGDSDTASHIYPRVAKISVPSVLPIRSFVRPAIRAATINVPNIIPVETYEGGET